MRSKAIYQLLWGCGLGTLSTALTLITAQGAQAFSFLFAGEANGIDLVTHPLGYTGTGGNLNITVGVDPTSAFASNMLTPTQNVVNTWNSLAPTTGNLSFLPGGNFVDFESVLLHEMGHSLGLAHINLASESGLSGADQNYTKSTDGANNTFDINPGGDGVRGSADDLRGDDVNLNYFPKADNDPFATNLGVVDSTTYSRDIGDLPSGDTYSANAERGVAGPLGYTNTEAAMQQGTFYNEIQRELGADDVAARRYSESGLDEIAGTADDYTLTLNFLGLTRRADIVLDFDNRRTGFASSRSGGRYITPNHARITSTRIFFNTGFNWFFNDVSNTNLQKLGIQSQDTRVSETFWKMSDELPLASSNVPEKILFFESNTPDPGELNGFDNFSIEAPSSSVPEPTSVLSFLTIGIFGAASSIKHN